MKSKLKKQLIAIMLCMVMIVSGSISTLAEMDTRADTSVETESSEAVSETDVAPVAEEEQQTAEASGENIISEEPAAEAISESVRTEEAASEEPAEEAVAEPTVAEEVPQTEEPVLEMKYEDDDIIACVSAEQDGVIPKDAALKVVPILAEAEETKDQYKEVEKKIVEKAETEEYDIAGFLAYDISFVDADGNKVEPNGEVKVSLEYKNAVAPDQLDEEMVKTSDVTVMHLEEDENGEVKDVVDLSKVVEDGKTEAEAENKIETMKVDDTNAVEKTEFTTESFSTFVITWTTKYYTDFKVNVHYVDQEGKEIDAADVNNVEISTNPVDLNSYKKDIAGYRNPTIHRGEVNGTVIRYLKTKKSSGYYYIQTSSDGSSYANWLSNSKKTGEIYIVYEKIPSLLKIEDNLIKDGTFVAIYENPGAAVTKYAWYRSDSEDGEYTEVTRVEYQDGSENISQDDGTILYPALDEGAQKWYKVKATLEDGTVVESDAKQVVYYNELQNGSFENPEYTDKATYQLSNAEYLDDGVWQTTGTGSGDMKDHDIEIVNTRNSNFKSAYSWHGNDGAKDGKQFAELNCEAAGALYQDVLTIPGNSLNYWLSHRARGNDKNKIEYDTMYLVIMPTKTAMTSGNGGGELKTQAELNTYLNNKGINPNTVYSVEGVECVYSDNGVYVVRITSDDNDWHDIQSIAEYIPTDSLTRFFFMAGKTASNNTTIGNFLDKVGFSQELPPVNEDEFSIQLVKKFTGLDNNGLNTVKNAISFTITAERSDGTQLTESEVTDLFGKAKVLGSDMTPQADGTLIYNIANRKIGNEEYKVTIQEEKAGLSGYTLTTTGSTVVTYGANNISSNDTVISSLKGKTTAKVTFTNNYDRSENKKVNFTKIWDDANNKFNTRPESLTVTLQASITVADGEGTKVVPIPELTKDAVLTESGEWKTSWDVPVYWSYNGVDVKINYTVVEGDIDSAYVYQAGTVQKGDGSDYVGKSFSNVTTSSDSTVSTKSSKKAARLLTSGLTPSLLSLDQTDELGTPAHKKYIEYNPATSDYTLNLDVTGAKGEAKGADIVFVIDTSGSMGSGHNNILPSLKTLLTKQNGVIDQVFATEGNVNSVAYVSFAGKDETKTSSWYSTSGKQDLKDKINNLKADGGTNWTYAMMKASELLAEKSTSKNEKVVIFLSDGQPTYSINAYGYQYGYGNVTIDDYYTEAAAVVNKSTSLQAASFYSVYLTSGTSSGMNKFNGLLNNQIRESVNGTDLSAALQTILNKVIPTYKNVTITDTLSENVVFSETNPTITVKKRTAAGNESVLQSSEYTASVFGGKVTVELLNGQPLEDGATYTISFRVKPSDTANKKYSQSGYADTGDAGTGATSAGKLGFYSNDKNTTIVSYEVAGTTDGIKTATYSMPVVQVTTHELKYKKIWNVPEGIAAPTNDVVLHVTYTDGTNKDITLTNAQNYEYSETVLNTKNIQSVVEDEIQDYTPSYSISEDRTSAVVTNSYSKVTTSTIEVLKDWEGEGPQTPINVSLYRTKDDGAAEFVESITLDQQDGWSHTWEDLRTEETINNQVVHYTYAVREESIPAGYTSNIVYTVEGDKTIAKITNIYDENCKTEELYIANVLQTEEMTVVKQWDDNSDALEVRPSSINVTITGGNDSFTTVLSTDNSWKKTLTLLKKKDSSYTATEQLEDENYELEATYVDGNTTTFVNKLKTTNVTVQKIWNDGAITDRPDNVEFELQYSRDNGANWANYRTGNITAENTNWTVSINDLPACYQYRVVEKGTAAGYLQNVTSEGNSFKITNTLKWSVRKTSAQLANEEVKNLQGAEFELKNGDTVLATGISRTDGMIAWTPKNNTVNLDTLNGEYKIHETKAPTGYMRSETDWTLTFVNGLLTKLDGASVTGNSADGVVISITNKAVYNLPQTGGLGIYWYTIGGMLLMIAAALILYKNKGREVLNK